ncbi:hypothetical protein FQA39_LY07297 [Lamprigera yunnana]|nr:hypothetical protein FQA39_LY07297 [Lamprigera yunnana]
MGSTSYKRTVKATDSDFEETVLQWYNEAESEDGKSSSDDSHQEGDDREKTLTNVQFSSSESDSDQSTDENIQFDRQHEYMIAKSGMKWMKMPDRKPRKARAENVIRFTPGPSRKGEIFTEKDAWRKFITNDMVNEIIACTNGEAARTYMHQNKVWYPINKEEMEAFIGILLMAGSFLYLRNLNVKGAQGEGGILLTVVAYAATRWRFSLCKSPICHVPCDHKCLTVPLLRQCYCSISLK